MFSAIPGNRVGNTVGLIQFAPRRRVDQSAETVETQPRQSVVERVGRNSSDPCVSGDIDHSGIKIRTGNVIVIVIETQVVGQPAFAVHPPSSGVQSLRTAAAIERWKYSDRIAGRARPAQPEIHIVLISPTATSTTAAPSRTSNLQPPSRRRAEVVDQPKVHRVRSAGPRSDNVKILSRSSRGDVRQRNILQ